MITEKMKVRLTFTDDILGTCPQNENVYEDYIASKAPNAASMEEEIEIFGTQAVTEKGTTIFPKINGKPFIYDYQIRGFFKGAAEALTQTDSYTNKVLTKYGCKKFVDQEVFVTPRTVMFNGASEIDLLQRPLRAQTMQGERVALAISERIKSGCTVDFTVEWLPSIGKVKKKKGEEDKIVPAIDTRELICEWLDFGKYSGIGQWRNSGMGRFTWEEICD